MNTYKETADKLYGEKLRIRVCGILISNERILLAGHLGLREKGIFWMPPGGGVEFGESLPVALQREIKEETGLEIEVGRLINVHEFISSPMHALEFFFLIEAPKGNLKIGYDPEMPAQEQILTDVKFFSVEALKMMPADAVHPILRNIHSFDELKSAPFKLTS